MTCQHPDCGAVLTRGVACPTHWRSIAPRNRRALMLAYASHDARAVRNAIARIHTAWQAGRDSTARTCPYLTCRTSLPPRFFACPRHWRITPPDLRRALLDAYAGRDQRAIDAAAYRIFQQWESPVRPAVGVMRSL